MQHLSGLVATGEYRGDLQLLIQRLRGWLGDRHVEVRREALLALARLNDATARETVNAWLAAEGPEADTLRGLAIRCARELDMKEHIPAIRKRARDPDEIVRIAAIVVLSQWGDTESRPAFAAAAQSGSVRLQRAGKAALARLDQPSPAKATPAPVPPEP